MVPSFITRGLDTVSDDSNDRNIIRDVTGEWDHADLPPNIHVGDDVFLESPRLFRQFESSRDPGMTIGDRVRVYFGGWGGGFAVLPSGCIEIGDDCVFTGAQFMCSERIVIGRRVWISYNAIVSDADFHPHDPDRRRRDAVLCSPSPPPGERDPFPSAPVVIGDDVRIGVNAIVLKGVTIGDGASVYAGAVVTSDVAPGTLVAGNPARPVESDDVPQSAR